MDDKNNKLFSLIQFLFKPKKYSKIKEKYEINSMNIESLLYGYRYCLNEIAEEHPRGEYIFSTLYIKGKTDYLKKKFYPGSDTKDESYYELYNKIENHLKKNPNEGCYICLCDNNKGYYHTIPSGFPGYNEKGLTCPYCGNFIRTKKEIYIQDKENKLCLVCEPVKRENYFRIFLDQKEIDNTDKTALLKINYMTKDEFKNRYIIPLYEKEEGLNEIDENKFKKQNKNIRNLNQISYRLLNYILYSHLFFAKLLIDSDDFDYYLPKLSENKRMSWFNTINECFILLKKELEKEGISRIDIFMNIIFKDLFNKLHDKNCIDKYKDLIDFENELNLIILKKMKEAKDAINKFEEMEKENCKDKNSATALLKEIYNKDVYKNEYPFYEYFYYSDYPDENYITDILEHKEKNEYPIIRKYLEFKTLAKKNKNKNDYYLDNLIVFNKVINLFNEKYSLQITKDSAEKKDIKDDEYYLENSKDFDEFIEIFNSFSLKDEERKKLIKLDVKKNHLCDFVLDDNNKYGKAYKKIYKEFIKIQNNKLNDILNIKYQEGIFNSNCMKKISIQKIKEDEIFTDNLWENINFIEFVFNSSYRKLLDTGNYKNYSEFELNLDLIEF